MRCLVLVALACALASACDGGRAPPPAGSPRPRPAADAATTGTTASDGSTSSGDDASARDGGLALELDAASTDAGSAGSDAGLDAGSAGMDSGAAADARPAPLDAAAPPDSGPPPADVQLTTTCGADFGGDPVVSHNGSIAVGSLRGFTLAASLQFDFRGQTGVIALGTRHRIDTGLVVNLVTQTTWTNLSQDTRVITGMAPDTIGGTLNLRSYDGPRGVMDVELTNVRLQNASDLSFCTINGRVRTVRLGR